MKDDVLVVTFSVGERTEKLSDLCFEKIGFNNRIVLNSQDGLRDKFFTLAEIANKKEYSYYIQNDADRFVFEDFHKLIDLVIEHNVDSSAGVGFDYVMNRFRGATPNIFTQRALQYLYDNPKIMPDVQKPLTAFGTALKKTEGFIDKDFKVLTNLHDYEQYPSKICNTFLNRLSRNHQHLYDRGYLSSLSAPYIMALDHAQRLFRNGLRKPSINYMDFSFLDDGYLPMETSELEHLYEHYKSIYNNKKNVFNSVYK